MRMFFSLPDTSASVQKANRKLTVGKELGLDQARVSLDLVHDRHDPRLLDNLLQELNVEVAHADSADLLGLLRDPHHLLPCLRDAWRLPVDGPGLAILLIRHEISASHKGNGPVDEVDVQMVGTELTKGEVEIRLNVLRAVRIVPELGDEGDFFPLDAGLGDADADLLLVPVDQGAVDMAVSDTQRFFDSLLDLSSGGLPGTKADLGDDEAVVAGLSAGSQGDMKVGPTV